jgi:large subunit ribosomal protein L29
MKPEELRELEREELEGRLRDSRRELYELRFKHAVGQLDDHQQISKVRHDIARILTFMHQRDHGVAAEHAEPASVGAAAPAAKAEEVTEETEE